MKFFSVSFLAAVMVASGTVAYAQLTLPVSDNFAAGATQQQWVNTDASYSTVIDFSGTSTAPGGNGFVFDVNDGSGNQFVWLTDDDGSLADYKVTAQVYLPSTNGTDWSRVGIVARAQTPSTNEYKPDGYYFVLDSDETTALRIVKIINNSGFLNANTLYRTGSVNAPDPDPTVYVVDGWNEISLEVNGDQISAWLNGVELPNSPYTDAVYASGRVGIFNFKANASAVSTLVDNITIDPVVASNVRQWSMY